ncbi:MAG: DUF4129 domain-containing protein [Chloroflexota bacterium]|nr:DUF4129 domain-containing protein [Chloroflexota bacterium]
MSETAGWASRAGVGGLVGVMTACLSFSVVTVFTLFADTGNCLGDQVIRTTSYCQAALSTVTVPGRYAVVTALLCGFVATAVWSGRAPSSSGGGRRWERALSILEPVAVTVLLVALGSVLEPEMRSGYPAIVSAGLVWVSLVMSGSLAARSLRRNAGDVGPRPLVAPTLTGIPVTVACAAIAVRFQAVLHLPHLAPEAVSVSAAIYAVTAMLLLSRESYVAARQSWTKRDAVVPRSLGIRWVASCCLLIAVLLLAAIVSPSVVGGASGAAGGASVRILTAVGLLSHYVPKMKPVPCGHRGEAICPGVPKTEGPTIRHTHRVAGESRHRSGGTSLLTQILAVLAPIVAISLLFLTRKQDPRGAFGKLRSMMASLRELYRRFRRGSRRILTALVDTLPASLVDPSASRLPHLGRLAHQGLSPREQIQRYYLDTLRYADRHGMARSPAASPEEFHYAVARHLGNGREAWDALTEDFVEARYSLHPIRVERATRARGNWRTTRIAIREARHRQPQTPSTER